MNRVVYSPHYNISFFGVDRLHPFDGRKYGRAWRCLRQHFGASLRQMAVHPERPVSREELLTIHTASYLDRLRQPRYVARALEIPPIRLLPRWMIDWRILRPMRWATMGTVVAGRESFAHGFAVNLGGGYHHAKPEGGEGFCIYSDIALAIESLRHDGLLAGGARVAYVDLDAHQGNGVCHAFMRDRSIFIFDMFNSTIYPAYDVEAQDRIDCAVRLASTCGEDVYLAELQRRLPGFLDSISRTEPIGLAIYNAGTDVYRDDPLGGLNVSAGGIVRRDVFTVNELRVRGIPTVMVLSGGYTRVSYRLVAESVVRLLEVP